MSNVTVVPKHQKTAADTSQVPALVRAAERPPTGFPVAPRAYANRRLPPSHSATRPKLDATQNYAAKPHASA